MKLFLGIDIGSTTSKCVVINEEKEVVAKSLITAGTGTDGPELAVAEICKNTGCEMADFSYCVATGYGRLTLKYANAEMSELSCHSKGIGTMFPAVRTIIDIGGQDAKVMHLGSKGQMLNFVMNDKCAAGTGRFLDVMANILHLNISELEQEEAKSIAAVKISSTCTVFAESEVISQLANGAARADVVAGICESVASRTAALVKRIGIKEKVFMSGGVSLNGGVRRTLERELDVPIAYSGFSQMMGAYGAAIYALEKGSR